MDPTLLNLALICAPFALLLGLIVLLLQWTAPEREE
jgi:hypothetical protein